MISAIPPVGSFKDDRREELTVGTPSPTPTGDDYRAILVRHRKTQLVMTRENFQRLARTYDEAVDHIIERVMAVMDGVDRNGTPWLRAQLNLMQEIRARQDAYRRDYAELLDQSMLNSAQIAADREAEVARLVGVTPAQNLAPVLSRSAVLTTGVEVGVQFGSLAASAVEDVANRYYEDGLKLSDRLFNLSAETLKTVEDTIVRGIADGSSARNIATALQEAMSADGAATPRYNAMRIARTEVNASFRESHRRSVIDPNTGGMKDYITGIRWNLSLSHKDADICDVWAGH